MQPIRRVIPQTDATGRRLSFAERQAARQEADDARRKQEREQKQVAKREAELTPPAPRLTFAQRQALRDARDQGRRDAEQKAAAEAKAKAGPVNEFRKRANAIAEQLSYRPDMRRMFDHFTRLADKWDADQVAKAEAAERQAAISADPAVATARDYTASLLKTAPKEFQTEVAEINGIAQAGDAQMAWQRIRDIERRIWQRQDEIAAEKRASKAATDQEFQEAANAALAAREAAEQSARMADELGAAE
jgi:hypothetical protein